MADQEKTQQPTQHQRQEFRKRGDVAKSKELVSVGVLFAGVLTIVVMSGWMTNNYNNFQSNIFGNLDFQFNTTNISTILIPSLGAIAKILAPLFLVVFVVAIASNVLQTGFLLTTEPLKLDLGKLNPLKKLKQLFFSKNTFFEFIKSLLKLIIVGAIATTIILGSKDLIVGSLGRQIGDILQISGDIIFKILLNIILLLLFLGALDFLWQKYQMEEKMKMTHQEVKDEYKQQEGDPHVKSKRKQKQREMSMNRMMQSVPDADVIVTNPTHFAVALKYDRKKNQAPIVLAKGADFIAQKIKEIAKENEVPIVENKLVARNLYWNVEVGETIPANLFKAVAQILAYVYKVNRAKGKRWLN